MTFSSVKNIRYICLHFFYFSTKMPTSKLEYKIIQKMSTIFESSEKIVHVVRYQREIHEKINVKLYLMSRRLTVNKLSDLQSELERKNRRSVVKIFQSSTTKLNSTIRQFFNCISTLCYAKSWINVIAKVWWELFSFVGGLKKEHVLSLRALHLYWSL